jgi:hypothetical protein
MAEETTTTADRFTTRFARGAENNKNHGTQMNTDKNPRLFTGRDVKRAENRARSKQAQEVQAGKPSKLTFPA